MDAVRRKKLVLGLIDRLIEIATTVNPGPEVKGGS